MMKVNKSPAANSIEEQAIAWGCRLDRGALDAGAEAELTAWLAADPRHRGAFIRALAAWKNLDRLALLPVEEEAAADNMFSRRRILLACGGLAAAAIGMGIVFTKQYHIERYQILTPRGEIRNVLLKDGSSVTANADTQLEVAFERQTRAIDLQRGEAWFSVAKDVTRPFIVTVGNVRVRAVGTAFSVRRLGDGAEVLVTEGVVETWIVNAQNKMERVAAGLKIFVSDIAGPSRPVMAPSEINRRLAWRNGEVVLDGETVADAAAEFNRYNERQLTVDPVFANRRFDGWFRISDPQSFARAVAASVGARVVTGNGEIHLAPAKN